MDCARCKTNIPDGANFCPSCGYPSPITSADSMSVSRDALYREMVGINNQQYYLDQFAKFDAPGASAISWNWPAFLVTLYWLIYRKMYLYALGYLILPNLVVMVASLLLSTLGVSETINSVTAMTLSSVFVFFVCPAYANKLYHRAVNQRINDIMTLYPLDAQRQIEAARKQGGTSGLALIIVLLFLPVLLFGMLAAIAIPAYQDYSFRVTVSEALTSAGEAQAVIENAYLSTGMIPPVSAVPASNSPYVSNTRYDEHDGSLSYEVRINETLGGRIYLTPEDTGHGVKWSCRADQSLADYLPGHCR